MRNKRIFTKYIKGSGMSLPLTGAASELAHFPSNQLWLLQEPIDIIGVELVAGVGGDLAILNAGSGEFTVDVSQVGKIAQDGLIAMVRGTWCSGGGSSPDGCLGDHDSGCHVPAKRSYSDTRGGVRLHEWLR